MNEPALATTTHVPSQHVPPAGSFGGGDFLTVLRRRHRAILLTIGIVLAAVLIFVAVVPREYSATATMLVDTDDVQLPSFTDSTDATAASVADATALRQYKIDTQIQLLSSRKVAGRVAKDLALHDDREFNPRSDDERSAIAMRSSQLDPKSRISPAAARKVAAINQELLERVTDRLMTQIKVEQDGNTDFVKVTVTSHTPGKAARIANKIATIYVRTQIEERRVSRMHMAEALGRRVNELREQLISQEKEIAAYRRAHGLDPLTGNEALIAQTTRLASDLASTRGDAAVAATRSRNGSEAMSPLLADLLSTQNGIQGRLAQLATVYGEAHPDVQKARAEADQVGAQIERERRRVQSQLATESSAQAARASTFSGDLAAVRSQSFAQLSANVSLSELERNAQTTKAVYLEFLSRFKEIRRQDDLVSADASLSAPAAVPTSPSFPQTGQVLGIAACAALIFSVIVAVVAEGLDGQVRTAAQVYSLTGLETLGMVPDFSRRPHATPTFLTVIKHPYTVFAEAVRSVGAALERQIASDRGKVILVTSALPADGKTTLAIGLTAAAVAMRRQAILVDLDLRRPGLAGYLGSAVIEKDLIDYLEGNATIDEVIVANPDMPNVVAVPVNRPAEDAGILLASQKLEQLFQELRHRFQTVFVNAPPTLAVGDARVIAQLADTTLLILRWGKTSPDLLRAAAGHFEGMICGVVFNRVDYAKHARMMYGDTVQHYRRYRAYAEPAPKSALRRITLLRNFYRRP